MAPTDGNTTATPCVAGVLVGGGSRRMGVPKALLEIRGHQTMVEHVVAAAGQITDDIVILGSSERLPSSVSSLAVLPDARPGAGPLAGLCSLLEYAGQRWSLLLACDMPLLSSALLQRLVACTSDQVDAVAFAHKVCADGLCAGDVGRGTNHTCCALYHPRTLPTALEELTQGQARLQNVLNQVRTTTLEPTPAEKKQLTNVNTPEELASALEEV